MPDPWKEQEMGGDTRCEQEIMEVRGMIGGNDRVFHPLDDEMRNGISGDIGDRTGCSGSLRIVMEGTANEVGAESHHSLARDWIDGCTPDVTRPAGSADGENGAVKFLPSASAFVIRQMPGGSHEGGEVPAC